MSKRKKKKTGRAAFQYTSMVKESHGQPLFGVQFYKYGHRLNPPKNLFSTVGSSRASIYECHPTGEVQLLQAYVDDQPEEDFYTCAWSYHYKDHDPILAAAGALGIIHILRPANHEHTQRLTGHGRAINELQFHPSDPNLLLSASKDHALRMWNIKTMLCVLVFGGEKGHRDEVLSVDFNKAGTKIVSCGMDHCLKVWNLEQPEITKAIEQSNSHDTTQPKLFATHTIHFPTFSTSSVHRNYVDCVRWFGDIIFSKSTDSKIVCWKQGGPRLDYNEKRSAYLGDPATILTSLEYSGCDIWYIRFSLNHDCTWLATGNQNGKVFVWNLSKEDQPRQVLEHKKCVKTVRQTSLNHDGSILIAVCDDGTLWRWDSR